MNLTKKKLSTVKILCIVEFVTRYQFIERAFRAQSAHKVHPHSLGNW